MRAQIKEKREVAKGTLLVIFDLLGRDVDFTPGQYFWVTLLDPPYEDERGPRRHISVVTSPTERGVLGLCTFTAICPIVSVSRGSRRAFA